MIFLARPASDATAQLVVCAPRDLERMSLTHLIRSGFNAEVGDLIVIPGPDIDQILVGVGQTSDLLSAATWRDIVGAATRAAAGHESINWEGLPDPIDSFDLAVVAASAIVVAAKQLKSTSIDTVGSSTTSLNEWEQVAARALALGEAVNFARFLVDQPPAQMPPDAFVEACQDRFSTRPGVTITSTDPTRLQDLGLVGLATVGRASIHPPQLLELRYLPERSRGPRRRLALVGKGITYDSGGLSLKEPAQLVDMKADMAGAAAVLGAFDSLTQAATDLEIHVLVALAENAVGPESYRPGDVISYPNGVTVEVTNTDAEGRLVLADALLRAQENDPDWIIDVATLTYGCVAALGTEIGGAFTDDDYLATTLLAAAQTSGDRLWRLPLESPYERHNDSRIGDLVNLPSYAHARATTAGLFLRRFVGRDTPWVHIDMHGPSMSHEKRGEFGPGATGYGTRLLVDTADALRSSAARSNTATS